MQSKDTIIEREKIRKLINEYMKLLKINYVDDFIYQTKTRNFFVRKSETSVWSNLYDGSDDVSGMD